MNALNTPQARALQHTAKRLRAAERALLEHELDDDEVVEAAQEHDHALQAHNDAITEFSKVALHE